MSELGRVPLWLWVVATSIVVIALIVLLVLARKKRQPPRVPEGIEDLPGAVRAVFAAASEALRSRLSDRARAFFEGPGPAARGAERRLIVLGAERSGKTALLRQLSRDRTFAPAAPRTDAAPVNLFRLDGGVAVDVAGRVLAEPGPTGDGGEAFHAVLAELRRAFPDRPADGVLLTLSATDLFSAEERDRIEDRARRVRRRLDEALRRLDMRVPVYLLITRCDEVPGFGSFVGELGEARKQAVFGWSSAAAPFDPAPPTDWVDEALASVEAALTEEQEQRFTGDDPLIDPAGFFLFPATLASGSAALRRFVDPIFHDAAGGPPPALRGLYFSGRAVPARPAGASAPPPPSAPAEGAAPPPILFVEELVKEKILAESNLAQPSVAADARRRRVVRALQIAAAVVAVAWSLGLYFALGSVERRASTVIPFMHALGSDLLQLANEGDDPPGRGGSAESRGRGLALLDKMGAVSTRRLGSLAAPTSLLSSVDGRVEDALAGGYDRVILDAFRRAMRSRDLLAADPLPPADALDLSATVPLDKTPELVRAERWLARVAAFEANVERYNALVKTREGATARRAQELAELAESLFAHKVDQAYFGNARHFSPALGRPVTASTIDLAALAPLAQRTAADVFGPLQRRLLEQSSESAVRADLDALLRSFEAVEAGGLEYTTEKLAGLLQAIERAEADFARAGLAWVPGDAVPVPPEIDRLWKQVEASKLLGPDAAARLRGDDEAKLRRLQSALKRATLPLSGPVLARKDGALHMKLAPAILGLKGPIEALLRQSYMTGAEEAIEPLDLADGRVTWDVDQIKNAARVVHEYEAFAHEGGYKPFPERVRATLGALAARRLRARTLTLVRKAARREVDAAAARLPESVLRADAENLGLAGAPLREILAGLGRAQLDDARDAVRAALRAQGVRVLKAAHGALEAEALYRVHGGTFDWWGGDGSPGFQAFEVDGAPQLAEYLAEQRTRAQSITKGSAEPLLALLQSPEVDAQTEPVVASWDAIATALRDHEAKKAGNSVAALERLIQSELPAVTLDNCLAELDKSGGRARAGDYFAERRRAIRDLLRARCASLSGEELREGYARLRREFLRHLGDRFPFAKGAPPEDAPPEATRLLLHEAGELRRRYRRLLEHRADGAAAQAVRFLDRLDRARLFLEPLWAQGAAGAEGALEVHAELRANAGRELRGNQIAEWTVRLADEPLTLGGAKSSAKWRIGDPVRVQLRWAKNSPDMPAASQGPHAVTSGRLVSFEHRGSWALLRLLATQESALRDSEPRGAGAHLLLFEVRTIPDPGGGFIDRTGTDAGAARVFIRLTVTGAGKDRTVRYPDFPAAADAAAL